MHFPSFIVLASFFLTLSPAFALVLPRSGVLAAPPVTLSRRSLTGQATFYGGNVKGGLCSFLTYTLPQGLYGTALSDANWANATRCGTCVNVQGPGGNNITAMVSLLLKPNKKQRLPANSLDR